MALGGYCYLLLLLLGSSCAVTYAQCEDETDCSSRCNPERWRRQLCVFYSRLQDWRSTAVECGLHVPDFVWDRTQPSTTQWNEARSSWNTIQQMWRQLAKNEGIIMTTDDSSGLVSGMIDLLEQEGIHTSDSVMGVSGDHVTVWREEHNEWVADFEVWKTHIQGSTSEGVELTLDPSDLWKENLSDWSNSFTMYNATYFEICPATL